MSRFTGGTLDNVVIVNQNRCRWCWKDIGPHRLASGLELQRAVNWHDGCLAEFVAWAGTAMVENREFERVRRSDLSASQPLV